MHAAPSSREKQMNFGYSKRFKKIIDDPALSGLGVELGRLCVLHNYSVTEVAEVLEVTRTTVYGWMLGKCKPTKRLEPSVVALVEKLRQLPTEVQTYEVE